LQIEEYFNVLAKVIDESPIVQSARVTYDKRSTHIGFIRGTLYLLDGSQMHLREFVDTETGIDRYMYAYQYQREDGEFVFRYDNTDHHRSLNLSTHPHHKHDNISGRVVDSPAPTLAQVLEEIEGLVNLA
jgi:hypothetical protein